MNKYAKMIIGTVMSVLLVLGGVWAWRGSVQAAYHQGFKDYHGMCFQIGGMVLDKEDGTVVQCSPLGRIPEQEMRQL